MSISLSSYAYSHLKGQLDSIDKLKFLFGEPTFIKSLDPAKTNKRDFKIEDDKIVIPIESRLTQKSVARECSEWIQQKVEIKSMVKPNFLHGKMYHITRQSGVEKAIAGSSNFTVNGLGLGGSPNIELNLIVDNDRDRADLKRYCNKYLMPTIGIYEMHTIPIKKAKDEKPFITLIDQILSAKTANPKADTSQLEKQIDELVYKLYELSDEEIAIIENKN
ncbi:MAG: phospholipase D-like domain-containing protein [Bacteroidetes bacterium]|nr:phospholipase D-like domain-containing protein [Bacteroidota bacterium]